MDIQTTSLKKRIRLTHKQAARIAIQCFTRFGVHRTSMNDIADAADVSRQTLYRLFDSRTALLEYIIADRIEILAKKLSKFVAKFENFDDALIEGMIYAIQLGRADELLMEITRQDRDAHFIIFLFGGTPEIQEPMLRAWGPLIDRGRAEGIFDPSITNEHAVEWLCNIGSFLNTREDYDEADHRRILRQFVVPSMHAKPR